MIVVVEDDDGMRQAVRHIVVLQGFKAETFATAEAYLASKTAARAKCLVLDIRLPGLSGIELYRQLHERGAAHERGDPERGGALRGSP
jgi:FixJ family two-component response regulator